MSPRGAGLLIYEGSWGWERWRTACSALVCVPFSSSHLGFPESPRKCYSFDSLLSAEKQLGSRWVRAL